MKKITLLLSAFSLVWGLNAQKTTAVKSNVSTTISTNSTVQATPPAPSHRTCATMEVDATLRAQYPDMGTLEDFEEWLAPRVEAYKQAVANGTAPEVVYTIPVIVHVIHNSNEAVGQGRNISQAQINSQIDVLNEDFRRLNSDASNTPAAFQNVVADCEIEFCLAQVDPNGNTLAEPGIDRVDATTIGAGNTTTGYSTTTIDGTIKPATSWDPNQYLNIWVCQISGGILGYAQFPSNSGLPGLNTNGGAANTDGVVIGYNYFGRVGNVSAPYNLGRTTTHEVGHWLGLRHIWGDATCGDDFCNDTPTQSGPNYNCPSHPSPSCTNSGDMFMNYMDYVNDNCMNSFTLDQKARIVAVITGATRRASLTTSTVCQPAALTANFTSNTTTINAGQTVTFTDQSTGPNPITTWSWNFDVGGLGGVTPATATTQGPHTVTYNNPGTYTVSLTVGDGNSTDTKTNYTITVNPAGTITCDSVGNWLINPDASDASTGVYTWGTGNGYVMGNNTYGDLAWADKITFSLTGKELTEVIYFFGVATGTGNVDLKVWGDNAGSPDNANVMATTSVPISSITPGSGLQWTLATAVPLSGDFYVGYDHGGTTPPAGDTVAVFSTNKATNSMWALESNNAWVDLSTYNVNQAAAIIPIACDIATGQKEALVNLGEVKLFPNPTTGTLSVILPNKEKSEIQIYNMIGELVYTTSSSNTNYVSINLEEQPNGVYFVSVKNNNTVTTQKVIISR